MKTIIILLRILVGLIGAGLSLQGIIMDIKAGKYVFIPLMIFGFVCSVMWGFDL